MNPILFLQEAWPLFARKKRLASVIFPWICIALIARGTPAFSQGTADYLIVDKPEKYTVLNQFQQPPSEPERNELAPYSPMQIIDAEETLGDQVTKAVRCELNGKTWFLQKDDAGKLLGTGAKNGCALLKGCTIVNDTVFITHANELQFYIGVKPGAQKGFLNKAERIVRVFKYGNTWYVFRGIRPAQYCWCSFTIAGSYHKSITVRQEADTAIALDVEGKIIDRFRNANIAYQQYFDHFNSVTGQSKKIPVWQYSVQSKTIHGFLNAPYRNTSLLEESTRYITRDLENVLMGKPYVVRSENGDITISPKPETAK